MKKIALLIAVLLVGLIAAPLNAQSNLFAVFLGQENGHTLLYRVGLDGTVSSVSSADAGDVLLYDADTSAAAYVAQSADGALSLHITDLNTQATAQAPLNLSAATRLKLSDQAISVIGRGGANKPTIQTFDRTTLAPIGEHSAQRDDSAFTIQAGGKWVMAYNPVGALDVFTLPDLKAADFELVGFAYTAPAWSPAKAQLQLVGSSSAKPNERFIDVIDFDAGTSTHFPLPGTDNSTSVQAQWSDHGRYVLTFDRKNPSTFLITDVSDGTQKTLSEQGFILTPVGWSFDDTWLLYSAQISATSPVDLFAYNVSTEENHPVHSLSDTAVTARWASDSAQLLVIARELDQSMAVFTVAAPTFDSWQALIPSVDAQIIQSSIRWKGSTLLLEYGGALLTMDTGTRTVLRLSPQTISVVAGSVQLIG